MYTLDTSRLVPIARIFGPNTNRFIVRGRYDNLVSVTPLVVTGRKLYTLDIGGMATQYRQAFPIGIATVTHGRVGGIGQTRRYNRRARVGTAHGSW
jgi:hypothetical protein